MNNIVADLNTFGRAIKEWYCGIRTPLENLNMSKAAAQKFYLSGKTPGEFPLYPAAAKVVKNDEA